MEQRPLLEMRSITKHFPGVLALSEVNFSVHQNEVVALVGENGAGKSTLMKILSGVYIADAGEIIFKGKPVRFTTPRQAQAAGIATIYQELNQVPYLSVTENITVGVAGIAAQGRLGTALPYPQLGFLIQAIAVVVLGGTSLRGGKGGIIVFAGRAPRDRT
jgi:ABC-type sugar transport system ATPase subunit